MVVTAQNGFHVVIEKGEDGYYVAGCHTKAREETDRRLRKIAADIRLHPEEFMYLVDEA